MKARLGSAGRLYEVAEEQQGFFTTKQAKAVGYAENTHPYHVAVGNWIREYRGIYRLALYPPADRPDLVMWSLWSRNRAEETQGVFSHETALRLHELSDVNPAKLHITVPPTFRRSAELPRVLTLHHGALAASDIQEGQGFRFTRPLRTILDVMEAGMLEDSLLRQAVSQALDRGLITKAELNSSTSPERLRNLTRTEGKKRT